MSHFDQMPSVVARQSIGQHCPNYRSLGLFLQDIVCHTLSHCRLCRHLRSLSTSALCCFSSHFLLLNCLFLLVILGLAAGSMSSHLLRWITRFDCHFHRLP